MTYHFSWPMCGIFFSYSGDTNRGPPDGIPERLCCRGPDHSGHIEVKHTSRFCSFVSSVLSLRGDSLVTQPLQDSLSGSVLCWNGEAWKIDGAAVHGNDAQTVFNILLRAVGSDDCSPVTNEARNVDDAIIQAFSRVSGPYAFVFYSARYERVYFGRDFLGRRSLLRSNGLDGSIMISSVCNGPSAANWAEVEANGIYVIYLPAISSSKATEGVERHIAWPESGEQQKAVSRHRHLTELAFLILPADLFKKYFRAIRR